MAFTALVVDDDYLTQELMEHVLKPIGGRVARASGAAEAWASLEGTIPDVLYVDLLLPRTHGLELLNWIAESHRLDSMAIIVVSAHDFVENCRQLGRVNAYLLKPVSARDIRSVTQMVLDLKVSPSFSGPVEMILMPSPS